MSAGADMFHHNADAAALGLFQAAKERAGVYVFGANADQSRLAPDRVIGSAVIDLPRRLPAGGPGGEGRAPTDPRSRRSVSRAAWFAIRPNPVLDSLVPAALKLRVEAAADSIAAGTLLAAPRPASMQA